MSSAAARRRAVGLLTGAGLLAVVTPAWVAYAEPSMAGYLLHPSVFVLQALPYLVGAALWIPAWRWRSETTSVALAAALLLGALALYVPVLRAPERWGGDMIGLAVLAISGVSTAAVLLASGLMAIVAWLRRRGTSDSRS